MIYEWFLVSGVRGRDLLRIGLKFTKINYNHDNSMGNRASTQMLTNLVGVHPKEHPYKICSKSVNHFKRSQKYDIT